MTKKQKIQLFEDKKVRTAWDDQLQEWFFSIVDVCAVLTDQPDYDAARKYWNKVKERLVKEGSELVTNCHQLKMVSPKDGKCYKTDVADAEQMFRIIQSIPSKKAEPFKRWMAAVAKQRLDQMADPELSIEQAVRDWRRKGYSESWINNRVKSIEVRKGLTDEWDRAGVQQGQEYASLTDIITREWSGKTTRQYKQFKGLKKENRRTKQVQRPNSFGLCLARRRKTTVKHPQTTQGQRSLPPSIGRLRVSERRAVLARAIPSGSSLDEVNGSRE